MEATDCIGRNCPFVVFLGSNPDDVASGTDYGSDCIAAGLTEHSKLSGIQHGVHKVGEVIFGCLVGLLVSMLMSKVWPVAEPENRP